MESDVLSICPQYPQRFQHFSERKNVDFQINIKKCRTIKKYEVLCGEDRCMSVEQQGKPRGLSTLSTISTFVDV